MTSLESKKLRVLEKLANTFEESVLDKVESILNKEEGQSKYNIPKEHYRLLEEDHQKYLSGELETYSWEEVKENARKAFDEIQRKKA